MLIFHCSWKCMEDKILSAHLGNFLGTPGLFAMLIFKTGKSLKTEPMSSAPWILVKSSKWDLVWTVGSASRCSGNPAGNAAVGRTTELPVLEPTLPGSAVGSRRQSRAVCVPPQGPLPCQGLPPPERSSSTAWCAEGLLRYNTGVPPSTVSDVCSPNHFLDSWILIKFFNSRYLIFYSRETVERSLSLGFSLDPGAHFRYCCPWHSWHSWKDLANGFSSLATPPHAVSSASAPSLRILLSSFLLLMQRFRIYTC